MKSVMKPRQKIEIIFSAAILFFCGIFFLVNRPVFAPVQVSSNPAQFRAALHELESHGGLKDLKEPVTIRTDNGSIRAVNRYQPEGPIVFAITNN
ncbi:MAG TPA: hypothetical protein VGN23_15520 [Verrucomicrobiae bacterium]|jgi:hypothetical protein